MPSGFGVLDAVLNRTGFGKAGASGFGVAEKVSGGVTYTKAGYAVAGLVGRHLGFCLRGDGLRHCGNRRLWCQSQRLSEHGLRQGRSSRCRVRLPRSSTKPGTGALVNPHLRRASSDTGLSVLSARCL